MVLSVSTLYIESDNLVQITEVKDAETDIAIDDATIKVGVYEDAEINPTATGVTTDEGGGEVGIPSVAHGLVSGDEIIIYGTINYDDPSINGKYTISANTTTDKIVITAAFVAETFNGSEIIRRAVLNANDIAATHEGGDASGYYDCILPDTMNLFVDIYYLVITIITKDTSKLMMTSRRKAIFHS